MVALLGFKLINIKFMNPEEIESKKEALLSLIPDLFLDFLYYDRKECNEVCVSDCDELINNGHLTKQEMTDAFIKEIENIFKKD